MQNYYFLEYLGLAKVARNKNDLKLKVIWN